MGKTGKKKQRREARKNGEERCISIDTNDKGKPSEDPILRAYESLSPEEKERYRKIGEDLYGHINFETGEIKQEMDALGELISAVKSGLHPKELSGEELGFLSSSLGEKWYEKFGYKKEDIEEKK